MSKYAYPIVGGPLDGKHATTKDFEARSVATRTTSYFREGDVLREGGRYRDHTRSYVAYNLNGGWSGGNAHTFSSMIWVYAPLIGKKITTKQREALEMDACD